MLKLLKQYKFILLILLICLIGLGRFAYEQSTSEEFLLETAVPNESSEEFAVTQAALKEENILEEDAAMSPQMVPVYICGQVRNPGVYYMQEDTLINEAIHISGGFTEEANTEYLNLASPIQAYGKIVVPKQGQEIDKSLNSYDNKESILSGDINSETLLLPSGAKCININAASAEELMELPGIGAAKAQAIKVYREENGGFKEISELTEVPGIGDKTFEKIQKLITVQ